MTRFLLACAMALLFALPLAEQKETNRDGICTTTANTPSALDVSNRCRS